MDSALLRRSDKLVALLLGFLLAGAALAEGPGSQLRTTPEIPQATPMPTNPIRQDAKRCEGLPADLREKCLADVRAVPTPRSNGPQSIGGGAGADASMGAGTTGGATFGGSAPR